MATKSAELEEFKEVIRSILISAKDGLPLRRIAKDYFDFMGDQLPIRKFGFRNEIELFASVSDAVRMVNTGTEIKLFAVSNEKTAHIAELVSKQKRSNTGPGRAMSKPAYRNRNTGFHRVPPRLQHSTSAWKAPVFYGQLFPKVPPWLKQNIQELLYQYPNGIHIQNVKSAYRTYFASELNHQDFGFVNVIDFFRTLHNENVLGLCEFTSTIVSVRPITKSYNHAEQRNNGTSAKSNLEKDVSNNGDEDAYIYRHVFDNLLKVIEHFPGGFPMTELCDKYKNVTGSSLVLEDLGYNNVQELVGDLEDIFDVEPNEAGEWILLDARLPRKPEAPNKNLSDTKDLDVKEIPDNIQQNIYDLLKHFSEGIKLSQVEELYEKNFGTTIGWKDLNYQSLKSMFMSLEFNPPVSFVSSGLNDVTVMLSPKDTSLQAASESLKSTEQDMCVPDDAIILDQVYTAIKVPYEENEYFPVQVSSVDSPGRLWLQLVSQTDQTNIELDNLMNELADFYKSPAAENYKIPDKYLKKSLNCAVLYPEDQDWHRGCIIGKPGPTSYEVLYYDYGTIGVVHKDLLRLLKKSFAMLPAQAFCARLANVQPLSTFYSQESTSRLLELSSDRPLMAQITSNTYMNMRSVILCDTTGEDDAFLNDILVQEGLVQVNHDQIELRRPFEVASPIRGEICNVPTSSSPQLPISSMYSNPQIPPPAGFDFSSANLYNPFASQVVRQLNSSQLSSISVTKPLQPLVSTSSDIDTQLYHPPSLSDLDQQLEHNNSILDLEILRRLEQRELARKNVPHAAVEPIQVSRTRELESQLPAPIRPENPTDSNLSNEQGAIMNNENFGNQEVNRVYVSSVEDENQATSRLHSSSASTISNPSARQLRYCKKVSFREEQYSVHLINFAGQPCFNSGDVSSFIFGVDIVKRILQIQKYPSCHLVVSREEQPALFDELEMFEVTGFSKGDAKIDKVILYPLSDVVKILAFLNHNKEALVEDIEELLQNFDPNDAYWMTNENSEKVSTHEEALQGKLNNFKEERKSILLVMLAEECSSIEDTKRLLQIHQDMLDLKAELSELKSHSKIKSATEQAREFLERVKIGFEVEKSPECSPSVTAVSSASVSSPMHVQTVSVPASCNSSSHCSSPALVNRSSNVMAMGQSSIGLQGYSNTMPPFQVPVGPRMPVVPTFCPSNLLPQNLQFPISGFNSFAFQGTPYNYNQWQS